MNLLFANPPPLSSAARELPDTRGTCPPVPMAPSVWPSLLLPPDSPLGISRLLLQNVQELLPRHGVIGLEPQHSVVRTGRRGRRACRDGTQTAGDQDAVGGMRRQSLVGDGVRRGPLVGGERVRCEGAVG